MEEELLKKFEDFDNGKEVELGNIDDFTDLEYTLPNNKVGTMLALALEANKFLSAYYILKNSGDFDTNSVIAISKDEDKMYTLQEEVYLTTSNFDIDMMKLEINNAKTQADIDHLKNTLAIELASIEEIKKLINEKSKNK